ncbi:hypothetical protein T10_4747, partial [Trichinella papuae]
LMRELEKPKVDNSAVFQVESHLKDVGDLIQLLVLVDLDLSSELPNSAVPSVLGSSIHRQLR